MYLGSKALKAARPYLLKGMMFLAQYPTLFRGAMFIAEHRRRILTALVVGIIITTRGYKYMKSLQRQRHYSKLRKQKQRERQHALQEMQASARPNPEITDLPVETLLKRLQEGSLKPTEVLAAYQAKAVDENRKYNFIVHPIREARAWSEELERSTTKGPLYGLPVSVKDNMPVAGYDKTQGVSFFINKPYQEDCTIVEVLKKAGAVPFVRTNMPQMGMSLEGSNPIYGQTLNPNDVTRTPGGSSSGEGAIVRSGASPLGFGSDTGGSIRAPAAFCGVYSIKPTLNRTSLKGRGDYYGNHMVNSVSSPIARDVDTLVLALKALYQENLFQADPDVPPLPFRNEIYESKKPLRIGYYMFDGVSEPVPSVRRAVEEAVQALRTKGHQVVEWTPPFKGEYIMAPKSLLADGGKFFQTVLKDDRVDQSLKVFLTLMSLPNWILRLASRFIKGSSSFMSGYIEASQGMESVSKFWQLSIEQQDFRKRFTDAWRRSGLDAVICPTLACPAPHHNSKYTIFADSHNMWYNVLDLPAGIVPVTKVTQQDIQDLQRYPKNVSDNKFLYDQMKQGMETSEGLPVAVQCVTGKWQEEQCLRVMKDLQEALKP